ncbi:hypothetical protein [Streptomyces sp. NBC_00366]|uniref:hypothetical protein n=1 Tax=Streptomyces sp. NBC_00366 TaxID=2975727 RepID=UPI002E26E2BF
MALLFSAWFGEYGVTEYERDIASRFSAVSEEIHIESGAPLPDLGDSITAVTLTSLDVKNSHDEYEFGFIVIDPRNIEHLIYFWNLRALGASVWPWPVGSGERVRDSALAWLSRAIDSGKVPETRSGSGQTRLRANVWIPPGGTAELPEELEEMLSRHEVSIWKQVGDFTAPSGWVGSHPMDTDYSRSFDVSVTEDEHTVTVPLPSLPHKKGPGQRFWPKIVAAQVSVFHESGFGPDLTFSVPHSRLLDALLSPFPRNHPEVFHRATHDGRAIGVSFDSEAVELGVVATSSVFEALLHGDNWSFERSDNGRFSTRLIELLGGVGSDAANQPSVRRVLDDAARSPHGQPIARLISIARRNQGVWPGEVAPEEAVAEYPKHVVYRLLARKLIRPTLPVRCPACATTSYLSPEELVTDIKCDMCSKTHPLGFILGLSGKAQDWHYRPAGALTAERIAETMAVMASKNVLREILSPSGGAVGGVLGLKISAGKKWSCEIDVSLFSSRYGVPTAVIGEIKSYRDPITVTDLSNLALVQDRLRCNRLEAVIVIGTLRDELDFDEIHAIRDACENAPSERVYSGELRPALPIVLTSADLSVPMFNRQHPLSWSHSFDILHLAEESCRRNLGLMSLEYDRSPGPAKWTFDWTPLSSAADE